MNFLANAVLFELSVFLHSIGSVWSGPVRAQHTYLRDMYPQYELLLFPRIEEISNERAHSYPNFEILNGRPMTKPSQHYLQRGRFIFASENGDNIESLGRAFDERNLSPVFDTEDQKWYTLYYGDLVKLGVSRSLKHVSVIDEVRAELHERYHEANPKADEAASQAAYLRTRDYEEKVKKVLLRYVSKDAKHAVEDRVITPQNTVELVRDYYVQEYDRAYQGNAGTPSGESSNLHAGP